MSASFPHLFSPLTLGPLTIKNRIFSTGHMTMMVEHGKPTDDLVAYHAARAAGGAGLIITEAARVHASGVSGGSALDASRDDCIEGYGRIARAVHAHGCAVFGQLTHSGRVMYTSGDGTRPVPYAPSTLPDERFHNMPRAMPVSMIHEGVGLVWKI